MTIKVLFKDGTEEEFSKADGWEVNDNSITLQDEDDNDIAIINFDEIKFIKEE